MKALEIGGIIVRLKQHENSFEHMNNIITLNESRERLNKNQTIDKNLQQEVIKEKKRQRQVLIRIFSTVKCLARHNLAFQGSNENYIKITMEIFQD